MDKTDKVVTDWWAELTEEDKRLIKDSEAQYGKGNYISHQQLMQQFKAWIANAEKMPTVSLTEAKARWTKKRKQLQKLHR